MSNCQRIKEYIELRIAQIDSEYGSEADPMKKLNLTTIRTSFSNVPLPHPDPEHLPQLGHPARRQLL